MSVDNNFSQDQEEVEVFQPAEKLEGAKRRIWEKARRILSGLGLDFSSAYGSEKGEEMVDRIDEIDQMTKGEDYDNVDDNLFLETEIDYQGRSVTFKMVAQVDPDYDPAYKIDYAKESPDYQKEAERRLMREAVIGEKLGRFGGGSITADIIDKSDTIPGNDMCLVKQAGTTEKQIDDFGYAEGRQLAATLFGLQYDVDASGLVNEVMRERGYANQYELENEFSEDIFNDFDGYLDNLQAILDDRIADKVITKRQAKEIKTEVEKLRAIIESRQMKDGEYSLAFNNAFLDNLRVGPEGNIGLSDWSNVGTTQNKELSLVNDISQALESARENLSEEQAVEFERGLVDGLREHYAKCSGMNASGEEEKIADAVWRLAKMRAFQE